MYLIRVHAIVTRDDDGGNAATVTADEVETMLQGANNVYAAAGVKFVFDKTRDFDPRTNTLLNQDFAATDVFAGHSEDDPPEKEAEATGGPNNDARTKVANEFPSQMVIFFRYGTFYGSYDKDAHKWIVGPRSGGTGSYYLPYFLMQGYSETDLYRLFTHESGHFFNLPHTFFQPDNPLGSDDKPALPQAAALLKKYVADHPGDNNPLNYFDGDAPQITDTPPDIGEKVFAQQFNKDPCAGSGTINIEFDLNGQHHSYPLQPDRTNPMSYFFRCPFTLKFSPDQIKVIKQALETGARRPLTNLSLRWGPWREVQGGGTTDAAQSTIGLQNRLYLFAKGIVDHEVYVISAKLGHAFEKWEKVHAGFKTNTAIGCATFQNHLIAFATRASDQTIHVTSAPQGQPFSAWSEMHGGGHTDGPVSAAAFAGTLYAVAKGINDHGVYINSSKDGKTFGNWVEVQGKHRTAAAPAVAALNKFLYVSALGLDDHKIYIASAADQKPFGPWQEVQGGGTTDVPVAMTAAGGRLCMFMKDLASKKIMMNSAVDGQPFRGWDEIPGGMLTDTSRAATQFDKYLYIFAKGLDQKHYVISAEIL